MRKSELSGEQYESKECLLLKENEKNQTKWKDIKQREKSFNIRDVVKKTTGRVREFSAAKAASSSNGFVASIKSEYRLRNDLLKTQMQPGRASGAKKSGWP